MELNYHAGVATNHNTCKEICMIYPGVHFSIDGDCNKEDLLLAALLLQAVQHDDDLSLTRFDDEMLSDFYSLVEKGKLQTDCF